MKKSNDFLFKGAIALVVSIISRDIWVDQRVVFQVIGTLAHVVILFTMVACFVEAGRADAEEKKCED